MSSDPLKTFVCGANEKQQQILSGGQLCAGLTVFPVLSRLLEDSN